MESTSSSRSFLTRPFAKRHDSESLDSRFPKGPLGLTTLSEPSGLAIADLIFVHGLNGGSKSTWTKLSDPAVFWPQQMLQEDAAFQDVRIHSFGYNSDLGKQSILNIHDFSRALLGSLLDCPTIPRDSVVSATHPLTLGYGPIQQMLLSPQDCLSLCQSPHADGVHRRQSSF